MTIAQAKLTAQNQISVPAEIRKRLGLAPGSVIEFEEEDGKIVVRSAKKYTFEDINKFLFPDGPPKPKSLEEMKEGIARRMREKYARD